VKDHPESSPFIFLTTRLKEVDTEIRKLRIEESAINGISINARSIKSQLRRLMRARAELAAEISEMQTSGY